MSYNAAYLYHLRTKNIVKDIEAIKRLTIGCESLLEVGSGTGRVLFSLEHIAKRCGVELSADFFSLSEGANPSPHTVSVINNDFLTVEVSDTYDVVLLAFNVMTEFLTVDARVALLEKCKNLLNKTGRIIVINSIHDFSSWVSTEKVFKFNLRDDSNERDWSCQINCSRDLVQQISHCDVTYTSDGEVVSDAYTSALMTRNELLLLYKIAKLNIVKEYGSYNLEPLSSNSEILIHILQKGDAVV